MDDVLARNWGWVVLRGVVALLFGLLTLFNPAITIRALILLFGLYALLDGLFAVVSAIMNRHEERHWIALLVGGLVGVAVGVAAFVWPRMTGTVLLLVIAVWAVIFGMSQIAAGIRLRRVIEGEWLLILAGVLSVLFGLALFFMPQAGALAIVIWLGAYATVLGIVLIALGLRLRSWGREHGVGEAAHAV
ncbi:MAG TPA: HdeD family acid-resistance protein [Gemmatimonadaceae bacterium]|nr:HdeD family acid-resistance protein [Gemmatimonadaceae bacterium]